MEQFTIISACIDNADWEQHHVAIRNRLREAGTNHVEIEIGLWVFKTKEAYTPIRSLESFFLNHNVLYVSIPLSGQLECSVPEDVEQALSAFGLEVYNLKRIRV